MRLCVNIFVSADSNFPAQDKTVWIDVLQQKIKTSDANNFEIFWNVIKFHFWKFIFVEMT